MVQLTNAGSPVRIPRFLREDPLGILSIGETGSVVQRHQGYQAAVELAKGHSSGNLYTILRHNAPSFLAICPEPGCSFTYAEVADKQSARLLEDRLLKAYFLFFGEL